MPTIGERIKSLRDEYQITQKELADATGIQRGNLSHYEKNKTKPSSDAIIAIAKFFDVTTDWLLTGERGENYPPSCAGCLIKNLSSDELTVVERVINFLRWEKQQQGTEESAGHDVVSYPYYHSEIGTGMMLREESSAYLPVLGEAAAGTPIFINEALEGYAPVPAKHSRSRNFLVRVKGDSMTGAGIDPGDLVVIRPQPVVEEGEIALFRIEKEEATIKYFHRQGVDIILKPANSAYKDIIIRPDQHIDIVGKVIEVIKKEVADRHMRYPVE